MQIKVTKICVYENYLLLLQRKSECMLTKVIDIWRNNRARAGLRITPPYGNNHHSQQSTD